jgi:ribosomal-protein-serine acetyltransferase
LATISIDEHLVLRPYEIDDFQQLFDVINGSRQHLGPWLNWVARTTRAEHSMEFIQQAQHQRHFQEALALGIYYDDAIVGGIGMHDWSHDTGRAQIGYWISREFEGKGIISRAVEGFITYLFNVSGLNKIEIHYVAANKKSAEVARKAGFRLEGIIRQSTMRNGMPEDLVITGLLKAEWKSLIELKENAGDTT